MLADNPSARQISQHLAHDIPNSGHTDAPGRYRHLLNENQAPSNLAIYISFKSAFSKLINGHSVGWNENGCIVGKLCRC